VKAVVNCGLANGADDQDGDDGGEVVDEYVGLGFVLDPYPLHGVLLVVGSVDGHTAEPGCLAWVPSDLYSWVAVAQASYVSTACLPSSLTHHLKTSAAGMALRAVLSRPLNVVCYPLIVQKKGSCT